MLIRRTLSQILNMEVHVLEDPFVTSQIHLPVRHGGLGLQSSAQIKDLAYWSSWIDILPILNRRIPEFLNFFREKMHNLVQDNDSPSLHSAFQNLHDAANTIRMEGLDSIPSGEDLIRGEQPPLGDSLDDEPGETRKGWQGFVTRNRMKILADQFRSQANPTVKARIRSCAGPNSGRWLFSIPFESSFKMESPLFRCALSRRLGLPVDPITHVCEGCGNDLDPFGWHRTTCMSTGRVQTRHKPIISIWQRIFREAGIPIQDRNKERMLRTTQIRRNNSDARRMDLICHGIDGVFQGSPLFMDMTIVSPLHGNGRPMPRSAKDDGAALQRADERNRIKDYPDIEASPHAQLLCLGTETYGRWSSHCLTLVRQLADYKSKNCPFFLMKSIKQASYNR